MGATSCRKYTPRGRRGVATLAGALACVVVLTGCSSDQRDEPEPRGDAPLKIGLAGSAGGLSNQARDELQRQVGDVLSAYVVGAFLGDYPRDDFVDALSSFTSFAAEKAVGDLDVLTARRYRDADDVEAEQLVARVSAFAAAGEATGATARVRFRFAAHRGDEAPVRFSVTGRLALVLEDGEWRIFAYRITQQGARVQGGAG
jgi:hypothetical protein